jgi:hypothetical protein
MEHRWGVRFDVNVDAKLVRTTRDGIGVEWCDALPFDAGSVAIRG